MTDPTPGPGPDGHHTDAGLFGAPVAGVFRPLPQVYIDGELVASGMPDAWRPEDAPRVVVDGVSITWGREELLEQPEPTTGRLQLFDASGSWATSTDLRGKVVELWWFGVDPFTGIPESRRYFRGRVGSPVRVGRKTVTTPAGERVTGSLVDVPLVSILLDLANMTPTTAWPAESMGDRAARVAAAAAEVLTGGVEIREYWRNPGVAPVAAADQVSLYDHLVSLYDASGADRMAYLPDEDRTTFVVRREYTQRGTAQLWWSQGVAEPGHARAQKGVYVRAMSGSGATYGYLDSDALEYPADAGITSPDRITGVRLTYKDLGFNYDSRTVELAVQGTSPLRDGVRTVTLDSILSWDWAAALNASDLERYSRNEAAGWRLEPLQWTTRKTGGFESISQARHLLAGAEFDRLFFLQRSVLPSYGIRPMFAVIGATITYVDGGWDLTLRMAPLATTLAQHAITWEEFDDGSADYRIEWWDGDNPRGMHESLTYEDLGHVARGLTLSTAPIGPDTGWDYFP